PKRQRRPIAAPAASSSSSRSDEVARVSQMSERIPADAMVRPCFTLRRYTRADEAAAIELWRRTWQIAYPHINFDERVEWWRQRWREELVPAATIALAEADGKMVGFLTGDPSTFDIDQTVVAPEAWGLGVAAALIAEAKRISPGGLDLHVN